MTPKEKKELKESLVKQLLHEGDSDDVKAYFNAMSIEELQNQIDYRSHEINY